MIWHTVRMPNSVPPNSVPPNAVPPKMGARDRAHLEVRAEIVAAAGRQLNVVGPAALSLRAVARELGMVSSAVYRYFSSRDALLTALIIEAYDELGDVAERSAAETRDRPPLERWVAAADAVRGWAVEYPQDYALLYGSPVPGYAAPDDTVVPGTRVTRALVQIVQDAIVDDRIGDDGGERGTIELTPQTRHAFDTLRSQVELDATDDVVLAVIIAWTQMFGLISFELFGQTRGLIDDHRAFMREAATLMASRVGLTAT
jgi:AcrR family transcriptional regulator